MFNEQKILKSNIDTLYAKSFKDKKINVKSNIKRRKSRISKDRLLKYFA